MSCAELFKRFGFDCSPRGDNAYRVSTPFSFIDGEPISLYFIDNGASVTVTDNADTLMHLRSIGFDISARQKWRSVRGAIEPFGLVLNDSGEISADALTRGADDLIARYLGGMLAITSMERERLSVSDDLGKFLEEVEFYLRTWKPDEEFSRYPTLIGHSGRTHEFHFKLGNQLIDAARPNSGKTGSILRKITDLRNTSLDFEVRVVIDDREDAERARVETDILSNFVSVLPFSRLANNLGGSESIFH